VPREEVDSTAGADAHVGGEVTVLVAAITVLLVILVFGVPEAGAPECLTETGGASLDATTRVMDTTDGRVAIPAGKIDDPTGGLPLVSPPDRFEKPATHADGVGRTADLLHHLPFALLALGHDDSSFSPATSLPEHRVRL
jgi:hypothetical protein